MNCFRYRLPATSFRLRATGFRLRATGYRLRASSYDFNLNGRIPMQVIVSSRIYYTNLEATSGKEWNHLIIYDRPVTSEWPDASCRRVLSYLEKTACDGERQGNSEQGIDAFPPISHYQKQVAPSPLLATIIKPMLWQSLKERKYSSQEISLWFYWLLKSRQAQDKWQKNRIIL